MQTSAPKPRVHWFRFLTVTVMKTVRLCLLLSSVGAFAPGLSAQTAAPSNQSELVELPAFTVSSDRANAYRATDSMSAARIRTKLIDTAASVNVITSDFLKDISAASLFDATQYVS